MFKPVIIYFFSLILFLIFSIPTSFADALPIIATISPKDSSKLIKANTSNSKFKILDVRTPQEFKAGHLEEANLLDFFSPTFKEELDQLDKKKTYLIYCRSGARSGRTLQLMQKLGFKTVYNVSGGILSWQKDQLPIVK